MNKNSKPRHFASDNYAGICPEAFEALAQANTGHEVSYGDDAWTAKASDLIATSSKRSANLAQRSHLERSCLEGPPLF
jgi:threonine aldolase